MAEHQGKSLEDHDIPTDDHDAEAGDDGPPGASPDVPPDTEGRGPGSDREDRITRKEAEVANRENPQDPGGPLSDGGWKSTDGGAK